MGYNTLGLVLLIFCVIQCIIASTQHINAQLVFPSLLVDPKGISVSGLSSGGAMATQLHFAHSSVFAGAGIISGIPYWCAADNVAVAVTACMKYPWLINISMLFSAIEYAATLQSIDSTRNLRKSQVYIFSSTNDTVIVPGVGEKVKELYALFIPSSQIKFKSDINAAHSFVTDNTRTTLTLRKNDVLINGNSTAGEMLSWIYKNLTKPTEPFNPDNIISFDQSQFTPLLIPPSTISMDKVGYAYIPTACQKGRTVCKLHVALHGCEQYADLVDLEFVKYAGYNEWAEANNIIILYPQAIASNLPYNPYGCWDWFAYTGPRTIFALHELLNGFINIFYSSEYATKLAPQISTIMAMINSFGRP